MRSDGTCLINATTTRPSPGKPFDMCGCLACCAIDRCVIVAEEVVRWRSAHPGLLLWTEKERTPHG